MLDADFDLQDCSPSAEPPVRRRLSKANDGLKSRKISRPLRFLLVNNQPSTGRFDVVAEHGRSAHPLAFLSGRRHFIPRPLANDLPFELGETEEDFNVRRQRRSVLNCWSQKQAHRALINGPSGARIE